MKALVLYPSAILATRPILYLVLVHAEILATRYPRRGILFPCFFCPQYIFLLGYHSYICNVFSLETGNCLGLVILILSANLNLNTLCLNTVVRVYSVDERKIRSIRPLSTAFLALSPL